MGTSKEVKDKWEEFYKTNLTEKESLELERKLIYEFWDKGECRANFHEGGCGGNTGMYDSPERSRKLSEYGKKRVGDKNIMWGKTHTPESRKRISEANKGKNCLLNIYRS